MLDMEDKPYEDIVDELAEAYAGEDAEVVSQTLLVFTVGGNRYAVEPSAVREILRKTDVFPVPFLPEYVKGLLNYYSKPYAVVDFSMFFEKKKQEYGVFLVLNDENSIALQVENVDDFYECSENSRVFMNEEKNDFFKDGFLIDAEVVPVVDVEKMISKVREDIEKT